MVAFTTVCWTFASRKSCDLTGSLTVYPIVRGSRGALSIFRSWWVEHTAVVFF